MEHQHSPKLVEALNGKHVCAVGAGSYHSLAVSMDGTAYGWGFGEDASLGMQPADHHRMLPEPYAHLKL